MNNQKKIIIPIILFILMILVIGTTYSFFNYTRTGSVNTVKAGRISFNSTQENTINLTNVFPTDRNNLNSSNSDTVTINIEGDTNYSEGIEYKVTIEDVNNIINGKEVPITFNVTTNNLGTRSSNYYNARGGEEALYKIMQEGEAYNGRYLVVGYIPSGSTGIDGSIDITAHLDKYKLAITDTLENGNIIVNGYENGTDEDIIMGREVITTEEWNSFESTPLSFKVKVEANEGIWVEPEKFLTMKRLTNDNNWKEIRANITSIEFHKDGIAPANYITSFDVTDETSDPNKGNITLYTIDDGLGNNTYKAIIVAIDTIYAPENSNSLFRDMYKLNAFNSENFEVSNVTNMINMFNSDISLTNLNFLSFWNTINVNYLGGMFGSCINITNIDGLYNWNTSNVTNMSGMFNVVNINSLNALKNWNVTKVSNFNSMFMNCSNLVDVSKINDWDISYDASFSKMFSATPTYPSFTKFPNGTWDSEGTFTPTI